MIMDYLRWLKLPDPLAASVLAAGPVEALAGFRQEFYRCLPRRADALFELTDAVLCSGGPVTSLVDRRASAWSRRPVRRVERRPGRRRPVAGGPGRAGAAADRRWA